MYLLGNDFMIKMLNYKFSSRPTPSPPDILNHPFSVMAGEPAMVWAWVCVEGWGPTAWLPKSCITRTEAGLQLPWLGLPPPRLLLNIDISPALKQTNNTSHTTSSKIFTVDIESCHCKIFFYLSLSLAILENYFYFRLSLFSYFLLYIFGKYLETLKQDF